MSDYDLAVGLIEANGDLAYFAGPRDPTLVDKAEAALGVTFPPTYRRFLERYGAGGLAGSECYGVIDDNFVRSTVPDGIWLTLDERKTSQLPNWLVIVYGVGDGSYFALDASQRRDDRECPVVVWYPGASAPSDTLEVVFEDFGALLLENTRDSLRDFGRIS